MTFRTAVTTAALSSLVLATLAACEPQPVREFKLTVRVDGEGSILVLPDDEACDDRCFFSAEVGSFFSFIARPDDGHVFVGWSGDLQQQRRPPRRRRRSRRRSGLHRHLRA